MCMIKCIYKRRGISVKTLYIDVYFLINMTVDLLALNFAARLSKITVGMKRLIISAVIGGLYAALSVLFIESRLTVIILSLLSLILMCLISTEKACVFRKIKYSLAFLVSEILIGGIVFYGFSFASEAISESALFEFGNQNRKLLILSLLVLLSLGILKLMIFFFSNSSAEKNVKIDVVYNGKGFTFEALVDSANMAVDPFDSTPVMLLSKKESQRMLGEGFYEIQNINSAEYALKKKVRLIPISFGTTKKILYGLRPDEVFVHKKNGREKISLTVAIDTDGEGYCGYGALVPLSALN